MDIQKTEPAFDVAFAPPGQGAGTRDRAGQAWRALIAAPAIALVATGCTPRVVVEAPSDPITINLNVKIDQEVRVKLDKEVEDLIADNPDLF